jgi:hypothetical protein
MRESEGMRESTKESSCKKVRERYVIMRREDAHTCVSTHIPIWLRDHANTCMTSMQILVLLLHDAAYVDSLYVLHQHIFNATMNCIAVSQKLQMPLFRMRQLHASMNS